MMGDVRHSSTYFGFATRQKERRREQKFRARNSGRSSTAGIAGQAWIRTTTQSAAAASPPATRGGPTKTKPAAWSKPRGPPVLILNHPWRVGPRIFETANRRKPIPALRYGALKGCRTAAYPWLGVLARAERERGKSGKNITLCFRFSIAEGEGGKRTAAGRVCFKIARNSGSSWQVTSQSVTQKWAKDFPFVRKGARVGFARRLR